MKKLKFESKIVLLIVLGVYNAVYLNAQKINGQYSTNGKVYTALEKDSVLFVGGSFTEVGKAANGFACVEKLNGRFKHAETFRSDAFIRAIIDDGKGGYYIGGEFTFLNDTQRNGLAHINSNGSVDKDFSFRLSTKYSAATIKVLHLIGDTLIVAGNIDTANGLIVNGIIGINVKTKTLLAWRPNCLSSIESIESNDSYVFLAGSFVHYENHKVTAMVQLDRKGLKYVYGPDYDNSVYKIVKDSSRMVVKGKYTNSGWKNPGFIQIDTTDISKVTLGYEVNGGVSKIISDPKGGWFAFTYAAYPASSLLVRLNADRSIDTTFKFTFSTNIRDITVVDSFLLCASESVTVNGKFYDRLVMINHYTKQLVNVNFKTQSYITKLHSYKKQLILQTDNELLRVKIPSFEKLEAPVGQYSIKIDSNFMYYSDGSGYSSMGNVNLAQFNGNGKVSKIKAKKYINVCNVIIEDGAGGWFVGGEGLVHVLANGNLDDKMTKSFQSGNIKCMLKKGDTLFIGGTFQTIYSYNPSTSKNIGNFAIINLKSGSVGAFDLLINKSSPNYNNGNVKKMLVAGDSLVLIGDIASTGIVSPKNYQNQIKFNLNNFNVSNSTVGFNYTLYSMHLADSFIYYGGGFRTVNGLRKVSLQRVNKYTNIIDNWAPAIDTNSVIHEITSDDSFLYVYNRIVMYPNGSDLHRFMRISKRSGAVLPYGNALDSDFTPTTLFAISKIDYYGDTMVVAGTMKKTIGAITYTYAIKFNKNTGVIYPFYLNAVGNVNYVQALGNGEVVLGGNINDIDRQNNVVLARYDLEKNWLDTAWKVFGLYSIGTPSIEVTKNNIYIAVRVNGSVTIDGVTRKALFRANKNSGAISTFNSNIPSNGLGFVALTVVGKKVFYICDESSIVKSYVFHDGKDSFRQVVVIKKAPTFGIQKGFDGMPMVPGEVEWYDISKLGRSYNSKLRKFQNGMNNYPGTFTLNNSNSSVFYNFKDSIYYLFETQSNTAVNMLGEMGNYYRVNKSNNEVKKLNFYNTLGINGFFKQDSSLYAYGSLNNVNTIPSIINSPVYIFKFNENKNALDLKFTPKLNGNVNSIFASKNDLYLMGNFYLTGKTLRNNLYAIDRHADTILAYAPDPTNSVWRMGNYDTAILISGDFTTVKSGNANRLALLDAKKGNLIHNFNINETVYTTHINGNKLYVGGSFTNFKSSGINNLIRYDLKTKLLDAWDAKIEGGVYKVLADDSFVYAAGDFIKVQSKSQLYFAKIRKDNGANVLQNFQLKKPSTNQAPDGNVKNMFLTNDLVYLSGCFDVDANRRGLIAIHKKSNSLTSYFTDLETLDPYSKMDIVQYDDKLLAVNTTVTKINGVYTGLVALIDRYQSITYPKLPSNDIIQKLYGQPTFSSSKNAIYICSRDPLMINNSLVGNLLILDKGKDSETEKLKRYEPSVSGNKGRVTLRLSGGPFSEQDVVYLVHKNDTIRCVKSELADINLLFASFMFNNDSIGYYRLHVKHISGKTNESNVLFEMVKSNAPDIRTSIIGYGTVRRSRTYDYVLDVENFTNTDLVNVPIIISVSRYGKTQIEALNFYNDTFLFASIDSLQSKSLKNNVYSILLPNLKANDHYTIPFRLSCSTGDSFELNTWAQLPIDNNRKLKCLQQIWNKVSGVNMDVNCINKSLFSLDSALSYPNDYTFGSAPLVVDYNRFYKNTSQTCKGTYLSAQLKRLSQFYANPIYTSGVDAVCLLAKNGSNVDSAVIVLDAPNKFKIKVVNSLDPNDKIGPKGLTDKNFMGKVPDKFNYVIRFENDSSASAPAQMVLVKDTIDKRYFDINTVVFTSFKVGDYKYYFAPGTSSVNKNFDFRKKANLILNLTTQIDTAKGIVTWIFNSLDLLTFDADKLNPLYGFLPPNNYTNRGQGSVSFEIKVKDNIGDDVNIRNRADIIFDNNKSILTPYWQVRKDVQPPSSQVLPLANPSATKLFPVVWKAFDSSGIRQIEVFVSQNNIVYTLWKISRADSSAVYNGVADSTYYFYSVAYDLIGNKESITGVYDTKTQVKIVSITNEFFKAKYNLFPNPSTGIINFRIENQSGVKINIYSMDGKFVNEIDCESQEAKFLIAQKGIYILEIKSGTEVIGIEKVIVD
jgi:hypothetical protein